MPQREIKRVEVILSSTRIRRAIRELEGVIAAETVDPVELKRLHTRISDELRFIERLINRLLIRCPNG